MTELPDNLVKTAMQAACREARCWLGATTPNPAVGAVAIDSSGAVLAVAAHERAGEAHAEAKLLNLCMQQNLLDKIHTLCVTLEPCTHHGRTPPCTDAIIRTGIKNVVIGIIDPNPNVAGGGIEKLRLAGIDVRLGVAAPECEQLIHAFAHRCRTGKPWVTIKRAINRDGNMIPPKGQKTFTGPKSLKLAHRLRKKADAILTGSGTILADNPLFTVRHTEDFPDKRRWLAILDRRNRVPQRYMDEARQRGFEPIIYDDLTQAIDDLAAKGVQDVMVEAGPALSQYILENNIWQMSVTVQQTQGGDQTDVLFNVAQLLPFAPKLYKLDWLLPS